MFLFIAFIYQAFVESKYEFLLFILATNFKDKIDNHFTTKN